MTRERAQVGFRDMNASIDEAADVYQEIKNDVQSGNGVDEDKLNELLAKVKRLLRLKHATLDEFPAVLGLPFRHLYQELKFINDAVELALRLVDLPIIGPVNPPSKEFIRELVELAKREKEFLEGELASGGGLPEGQTVLTTLNAVLEVIPEQLNEDPIDWPSIKVVLGTAQTLKKLFMADLPDVFGTSFASWYNGLKLLDQMLVYLRSELLDIGEDQIPRIGEAELKMMEIKLGIIKDTKELLENYIASAEEGEEGG